MAKCLFPETTGQESSKPVSSGTRSSSDMRNAFGALFQGDLAPLRPKAQSTPDMTIAVNPALVQSFFSQVWLGTTTPLNYAGGNSGTVTAPTSNPRIDLLTIDSSGTLAWTTGSEGASPTAPDCPAGKMPICYIYCKTTMTKIVNYEDKDANPNEGYIYKDVRPFLNMGGSDEKVKASSGDSTADYLDGKVDDFTIEVASDKLKVKDRIELNIMLLAFKLAVQDGLVKFNMVDGFMDEFEDESGVDTANCTNQSYDSSGDYYAPSSTAVGDLLIHFNGTDGATAYTAETGQTVTFVGTAQLDTADKKFGASALLLDGNSDKVTIPDSDAFDFGSGDFTIECFLKSPAFDAQGAFMIKLSNPTGWAIAITDTQVRLYSDWSTSVAVNHGMSTNTWYHLAIVRNGSYIKFFVNGTQVGTNQTAASTYNGDTNPLAIGGDNGGAGFSSWFNGWIDEVRITKGTAVYTSNFTAPSSEFVGTINNMTLVSNAVTAEAEPANARLVLYEEDVDSITVNTDIKAYVSIDGGSNYDQVTLADEGDYDSGKRILTGIKDVSARTGTSVKWKVETLNNKDLKLHAVGGTWD